MIFKRGFCAVVAVLFGLLSHPDACANDVTDVGNNGSLLSSIVIRLDPSVYSDPSTVVAAIAQGDSATLETFGFPRSASLLWPVRVLPEFLRIMSADDPRIALHQSVILAYASNQEADMAQTRLLNTQGVDVLPGF